MTSSPGLQIQLTVKSLITFIFFFFLMHELHEQAHLITGRIICGGWGTRDFNVWALCSGCSQLHTRAVAATFAGPLFTFTMLWWGRYLLKAGRSVQARSIGLVMILGNMQFGRIYMALTGSGDELTGFRALFQIPAHTSAPFVKYITVIIVTAICLPPLITAYRAISNKWRGWIYATFLLVPLILDTLVILVLLNGMLTKGVMNKPLIMGAPVFVYAWLVLCIVVVSANFKALLNFAKNP